MIFSAPYRAPALPRRWRSLAVACCFAFLAADAAAQPFAEMRFRHLSVEDGLASGSVSALLQDRDGYVWIGVHGGLCRYDGVRLEPFFHEDADARSLSSNLVTALAEDLAGRLWVGSDKGVSVLGAARDTFARFSSGAFGGAPSDPEWITALACDPSGDIWISSGSGLVRAEAATGRFQLYRPAAGRVPAPPFWGIAGAGESRVWLGSPAGLDEFDAAAGEVVRHIDRFDGAGARAVIGALYRDANHLLWVGTIDGLVRFDPATGESRLYRKERPGPADAEQYYVAAIGEDDEGNIWAATPSGVLVVDRRTGDVELVRADPSRLRGLGSNQAIALARGNGGAMFVGTRLGLDIVSRHANKFRVGRHDPLAGNSLRNDRVWSFCLDTDATLWIGTTYGLDRLDLTSGRYLHRTGERSPAADVLAAEFVNPIAVDRAGAHWFGTWGSGLVRVSRDGAAQRISATTDGTTIPPVFGLSRRRDGGLWVGTSHFLGATAGASLRRVDPGPAAGAIGSDGVTALLEDGLGGLWIGSARGFFHAAVPGGAPEFVPTERVMCFAELAGRPPAIAVGTSAALEIRDARRPERCLRRYGRADGLPSGVVASVLEEREGILWVGTSRGLVRLDRANDSMRVFDVSDGLPGMEFNQNACLRAPSGELFFGTNTGFIRFFPDQLPANRHIPPIVVRSLRAIERGGRRDSVCGVAGPLAFDHTWNTFAFEFAALDYAMPEKNRYAIMLEGFDEGWRVLPLNQHAEMYTNLDPGTYTFRVKGSNGDGVWNESGAAIAIVVRPPFWETWWFRAGAAAVALVAVAALSRVRGNAVARRNVELERRVGERTLELNRSNQALHEYKENLEAQVRERTRALESTVATLQEEVSSRTQVESELLVFQAALRRLASDLSRSEERERRRVAVFLHDVVGQTLFFCKMKLGSLAGNGTGEDLRRVHGLIEDLLNQVQSLTFELSPPVLYELGLEEAITRHIGQLRRSHSVEIVFARTDYPGKLSDEIRFVLFTATRELLANALKHASATRIDVAFGPWDRGAVRLAVRDNGAGFDGGKLPAVGAAGSGGFGLFHVRERLTYLGGSFEVASAVGHGTTVEVLLPVDAPA